MRNQENSIFLKSNILLYFRCKWIQNIYSKLYMLEIFQYFRCDFRKKKLDDRKLYILLYNFI